MQVIAGKYRGRKLISLDTDKTRPTLARVKESMFAMLDEYIPGATVLDLFAGSGALGIEALSRGAAKVYFADSNPAAKAVLEKNLRNVKEPFEVMIGDFSGVLKTFKDKGLKFDLVLLDPPYASDFGAQSLELLAKFNLLNKNAIVALEHNSKKLLQNQLYGYIMLKVREYGTASLTIFKFIGD